MNQRKPDKLHKRRLLAAHGQTTLPPGARVEIQIRRNELVKQLNATWYRQAFINARMSRARGQIDVGYPRAGSRDLADRQPRSQLEWLCSCRRGCLNGLFLLCNPEPRSTEGNGQGGGGGGRRQEESQPIECPGKDTWPVFESRSAPASWITVIARYLCLHSTSVRPPSGILFM